jgi:hypothetical protein
MHADCKSNLLPGLDHTSGSFVLPVVFGSEDDEAAHEPGLAGTRDHGVEIPCEFGARKVAMRIDHDGR